MRRLAATIGEWSVPGELPPLAHWIFHVPQEPQSALGPDGHPRKGGFLPPIEQPRRMWAGGRVEWLASIPVGATMHKTTTIASIEEKRAASGSMTLLTLRHVIAVDGRQAIVEEQDIVYLPIAAPAATRPVARPVPASERAMVVDERLLFRFSALTFNAHRIHYDLPFAREVELYPALVVHGPLQAMLLARDAAMPLGRFAYRGRSPLYANERFFVRCAADELWIAKEDGTVTMTATAE
ncbi:N-terminal of MaoC-like dehydratase domain-containing protein [Sphingomonas antarctica]|uniref:acyl-CoA dehydrogenase n=1 Tax=Sphingomonas antarctica TaxID=2040274 RepID=UPI0039E77444